MSEYIRVARTAISTHGRLMTFKSVSEPAYDVETGTTTASETSYSVTGYRKHIKASQYNYPNLIGKDAAMFYFVTSDLAVKPKAQDIITDNGADYKVESTQEHEANGVSIIIKVIAVKG